MVIHGHVPKILNDVNPHNVCFPIDVRFDPLMMIFTSLRLCCSRFDSNCDGLIAMM